MAIAYWDFKHFASALDEHAYYYILKYKDEYYYVDDTTIYNCCTLECFR